MTVLWWAVLMVGLMFSLVGLVALTADFIAGSEFDWPEEEEA